MKILIVNGSPHIVLFFAFIFGFVVTFLENKETDDVKTHFLLKRGGL